ncbi:MAG: alpha-amylase family glycosyl hydrolase [Spirochaetales bacterium]
MSQTAIPSLWGQLYPFETRVLGALMRHLEHLAASRGEGKAKKFATTGLVYCVYPDAFGDLDGLGGQLPRLQGLGVSVLWLLPLLSSPGRDQGFDISDYTQVDARHGGNAALSRLLQAAEPLGIHVIFDIAVNHTSDLHPWFVAARDPGSPFRDYYLWSETGREFSSAPLVFPGLVDSNWTWRPEASAWNFHRFYPFQPDLNYRNPQVAFEMVRILTNWKVFGVNGFRMDAAALLWKEEGTDCDSRPQVHLLLRLFQACLDALGPGSLLLAEANVAPEPLLAYFGDGDECKAAYHFDLMPRFYQTLLDGNPQRLAEARFPDLPADCAWLTFLRLHDEVTLELVPIGERAALAASYTKLPEAAFRNGQAFSGRLFDLFDRNPAKTLLAWSLLFSLPGTPILYYGDEIGMENNGEFYRAEAARTGFADSRFLHRGPWDAGRERQTRDEPESPAGRVHAGLLAMLQIRKAHPELVAARPEVTVQGQRLTSVRSWNGSSLTIVNDLSAGTYSWSVTPEEPGAR